MYSCVYRLSQAEKETLTPSDDCMKCLLFTLAVLFGFFITYADGSFGWSRNDNAGFVIRSGLILLEIMPIWLWAIGYHVLDQP